MLGDALAGRDEADEAVVELAGYEDLTELAAGGFGVVYRARQIELDRTVAIKVLTAGLDARSRARFERECRTMARLSGHPHIVVIHDAGISRGRAYIVMEYLTAGSLADRLERDGPLPWREATEFGIKLAAALAVAHRGGILHRDIKPENVLVSEFGEPKLGDFGIAQAADMTKTQSGAITATVAHAAPEVLAGESAGEASDVYSLGSTLYALIAGRPAFVRDTDESFLPILSRVGTEAVPDLRTRGVPDSVCKVLEAAMGKEASGRPSATEFADRLRGAIPAAEARTTTAFTASQPASPESRTRPVPARQGKDREALVDAPPPPTTTASRKSRRRLVLVAGVIAGLVLAGAVSVIALTGGGSSDGGGETASETLTDNASVPPELDPVVTAAIEVGGGPFDVGVGAGAVWVSNLDGNAVSRIDPATNTVTATIAVGLSPNGVAVGEGAVWVSNFDDDTVSRIDPATNTVTATIAVGMSPQGLEVGEGAVWVASEDTTVSRIDPATNTVTATIGVGGDPLNVAVGEGAVWVTNSEDNTVSRIDPATNTVTATIAVGMSPQGVAVGEGAVWVSSFDDDTVSRIDPATDTVTATIDVGLGAETVAVGENAIWVVEDSTVSRIDPATDTVTDTVGLGASPVSVAVGEGAVWVTDREGNTVSRIE